MSREEEPSPTALASLFERAKAADEFEFISTLLRLRGMEDRGWDPLEESGQLIHQTISQIEAPIEPAFKVRLLLFLYCHVTEMHDLYHMTGNLIRVCLGDRYSMNPFAKGRYGSESEVRHPANKIKRIQEWAVAADLPEIGELLGFILVREVRNAFYHSDYVLFDDELRIVRGQGVTINDEVTRAVKLSWLLPRMELAVNTVLELVDLVQGHQRSYTESKILPARFSPDGSIDEVELLIREGYGVVGFRSRPKTTGS